MKGNAVALAAAMVVLVAMTAVITHLLTKRAAAHREPATMPPNSTSEAPPPSGVGETDSDILKEILIAKSVVDRYTRATTARDEAAAATFTCGKKDGGMLWIGAVGRRITVPRVVGIYIEPPERAGATVQIQVEGKPPSPVTLQKSDGVGCIWL